MKKKVISVQSLITSLQLAMIVGSIFSVSAVMSQTSLTRCVESRMPDEFQLIYHVVNKNFISKVDQKAMYERDAAFAKEEDAKKKSVHVSQQKPFPGLAPDRIFNIDIAQSQQKFYWSTDEKLDRSCFIYDGKRSYYYDYISHRMFIHPGFKLMNGMMLPLPGRSLANIPMLQHASETTPGRVDGEVYSAEVGIQDRPFYMPGYVEINAGSPNQIARALCNFGAKKAVEHVFSDYVSFGGITIPKTILQNMYNLQTEEKKDIVFLETTFQLASSSLSSPPEVTFDPISLLTRNQEGNKPSPEFVQWYFENDREVTFIYQPGRSLEDQAGIEDYQEKKATDHIENGRVDPRNYVGLGLLLFLLAMAGWKVKAVVTGRRRI